MKYTHALCALVAALAAMPMTSLAQQQAYVSKDANLRAGPSRDYPIVAVLRAGVSIWVDGCLDDYRWCDVTIGPDRGWLYAGNIVYPYQGARVPLLNYGGVIGIGIISFSLMDYWDNHYQMRPWYPQRQHWIDRPPPVQRPGPVHIRPLPPMPPRQHVMPDGAQRPPAGPPPAVIQHPPPPVNAQRPPRNHAAGIEQHAPPVVPPAGAQRPPAHQAPPGAPHPVPAEPAVATQRPPQGQPPAKAQRPPQGQPTHDGQRPPQGQRRDGGERPPWEELPGGGKK